MAVTGTFTGSEIEVSFRAQTERTDYGVPGSPVWNEIDPDTIEVFNLTILGHDVNIDDLPEAIRKAIIDLIDEIDMEEE